MIPRTSLLPTFNLHNKRVFVRADLNVPIKQGIISNDYRLQAVLPTLNYIQKAGGKIILATHIGRPHGVDPALSTRILVPWFTQHGYSVHFQPDLDNAYSNSVKDPDTILLLENLRFFPGEQNADTSFAQKLASLGDYYVDDAFGALHRTDASITLTPTFFSPDKRTIGFLVERELQMLDRLLKPEQPLSLILGGGKVADKIPIINALLPRIHALLLCPAISNTFVKALGNPMGKSLIDEAAIPLCKEIMDRAQELGVIVYVPVDYYAARDSFNGPLIPDPIDAHAFPDDAIAINIGPKTVALYAREFMKDHTLFINGLMGDVNRPETLKGTELLYAAIGQSPAFSIIGGGDSVAAAYQLGKASSFDYLSTGGGATLAYISGQELPGLSCIT
ncbi:MAG: phosphoglycerate kinase [Candidatus Babeliales bacterium]